MPPTVNVGRGMSRPTPTRMHSVACRSIPRANGIGADGCGAGWTQPAEASLKCPRCGRRLVITDEYLEIPLTKEEI